MNEAILSIESLEKEFVVEGTSHQVIRNLNLTLTEKSFVCILGYTGCGKSTLLRMICGFEKPNRGRIYFRGKLHESPTRKIAMVFQDMNQLFPWKTAQENIAYAIRRSEKKVCRKEAEKKALDLLKEVGLEENAHYYPHQLSGGMRQRVAVARALAMEPEILLMDEPLSALDELNRRKLQTLCRKIYEERDILVLFVTHSVEEAITLSDKIIIMNNLQGNVTAFLENEYRKTPERAMREKMRKIILNKLLNDNEGNKGEKS